MNTEHGFQIKTGSDEASLLIVLLYLRKIGVLRTKNDLFLVPQSTPVSLIQSMRKHCFVTLHAELSPRVRLNDDGAIFTFEGLEIARLTRDGLMSGNSALVEFAKTLRSERYSRFAALFLTLAEWSGCALFLEMAHAPADLVLKARFFGSSQNRIIKQ